MVDGVLNLHNKLKGGEIYEDSGFITNWDSSIVRGWRKAFNDIWDKADRFRNPRCI